MSGVTTRKDPDFYKIMGPVFGSRKIQRLTTDRFYDDADKTWYYGDGTGDDLGFVLSIKDTVIKNVYIEDVAAAAETLSILCAEVSESKVPARYRDVFEQAGFTVLDVGKNYMTVKGWYEPEPEESKVE